MPTKANSSHYEVIVLGVGSMGSAACWYLAAGGQKVLGLDQFDIPHENGSHAGQSRIIRKAYFEHPDYVPLLNHAYENWRSLEMQTGSVIYHRTGVLYFGRPQNENIAGIRRSASLHNIPIENWTSGESQMRYPAFHIPPDFDAIFESDAGFVTPERAVELYVRDARKKGAVIKTGTNVISWRREGSKVRIITNVAEYTGDKLIITAGAWASRMIPQLQVGLQVTRQLLAWVSPRDPRSFSFGNFPCWFVEDPDLGTFYGFPLLQGGVSPGPIGLKLAHHYPGVTCGPDDIGDNIPHSEEEKLRHFLRTYLPEAGEKIVAVKNCLYTYSPDSHFIIDHLPGFNGSVTIACGFSGHGFKFASVIGEILADLAMKGRTDLPIEFLRLKRF